MAPALVISQVAFSLLLLIGAGLFVRSLENLRNVDAGFHHEGVLLIDLDPRRAGYKEVRLAALYQEILARLMGGATVEVLASGSLAQVSASVRQAIQARLPDAQMVVQTFTAQVNRPLIQERLLATLASFFGVLALGLAAVGLYGLMSYGVTRRKGEIGIRMALGAKGGDVLWLVLRGTLRLVVAGVVMSLPTAWAASRLISTMLFGLSPTDPVTIAFATAALVLVAALAGYLPARRASRLDPIVALRYE